MATKIDDVWDLFAAAALASGADAKVAATRADDMVRERRSRAGTFAMAAGEMLGKAVDKLKEIGGTEPR